MATTATYHLAWTHGLDEEAPPANTEEKPNGPEKAKPAKPAKPAKVKAVKAKPAKPVKAPKETKPAKPAKPAKEPQEKGPLDTRPGTHKHRAVELLLEANRQDGLHQEAGQGGLWLRGQGWQHQDGPQGCGPPPVRLTTVSSWQTAKDKATLTKVR